MLNKYKFWLFAMLIIGCTGSKKLMKQGLALQEAGLIEQANTKFIEALKRNPNNIDAQIALKRSSEMVLSDRLSRFFIASTNNDHEAAVNHFNSTQSFLSQVNRFGINLEIPTHVREAYRVHEDKLITQLFEQAQDYLDQEQFDKAEATLKKITSLRSDMQDVQEMKAIAYVEPRYRKAVDAYDNQQYRAAYHLFTEVELKKPNYKDTRNLRRLALEKAQFTIGVLKFDNQSNFRGYENLISGQIISGILSTNDPFIRVIDRTQTDLIIREQKLSLQGIISQRNTVLAGEMLGANALLTGRIINYNKVEGKRNTTLMPGYLGNTVRVTDPVTKEVSSTVEYKKVRYQLIDQENTVSCQFQYQLTHTETGQILISETINLTERDRIEFAFYNGDTRNLFSGHWKNQFIPSSEDRINTSRAARRELNDLLNARQEVKSIDELNKALQERISNQVIAKLATFNPERR